MTAFKWNWQKKDWPHFYYDNEAIKEFEIQFLKKSSEAVGIIKHITNAEKDMMLIEILSDEALKTSEIEGDYLNRSSIQESIRRNLGLGYNRQKIQPAEFGISEMMVNLYQNFNNKLEHETLYEWHRMITNGRRDLIDIGKYRTHDDPMQIVSGRLDKPTAHFQAPPSEMVTEEMEYFINWFNREHVNQNSTLNTLALSGITHYYFLAIHPFEDGNGRIARGLSEKSIAINLGQPSLISLSQTINLNKKEYYSSLENHNTKLDLTEWLQYYSQTVIKAHDNTVSLIEFILKKAKYFDKYKDLMNNRQHKVIKRIFKEGFRGFEGGLSAENYKTIAKTSASTATRDLNDMLKKKMVYKTGKLKSTRYYLALETVNF